MHEFANWLREKDIKICYLRSGEYRARYIHKDRAYFAIFDSKAARHFNVRIKS